MKIDIIHDATQAKGIAVVIDIFRAATVEAFVLGNNAEYIIPVKTKEEAFALREAHTNYFILGEDKGIKIEGFDYGNSPSEIKNVDFTGKVVVHRSSHGTQGLVDAFHHADEVIFGSFVTFSAIHKYIEKKSPEFVTIIPTVPGDSEDEQFAFYLQKHLEGHTPNMDDVRKHIKGLGSVLLDPNFPEFPEEDFHLSLTLDLYPFICLTDKRNGQLIVRKKSI